MAASAVLSRKVKLRECERPLVGQPSEPPPGIAIELRRSDLGHKTNEIERLGQVHDAHLPGGRADNARRRPALYALGLCARLARREGDYARRSGARQAGRGSGAR